MACFDKILVAVDFSPDSDEAVQTAISLAKRLGGEIHLVHAFHQAAPIVLPYAVAIPPSYLAQARGEALGRLETQREKVAAEGIQSGATLGEMPAPKAIVEAAEEIDANLIVMGTRGNTGLKHVLLGSVAERTLRHAPCPVLAVKARSE